jgi:DNA-binding protein HU-beta
MNRIGKGQLAEMMARSAGITKAEAGRAIDALARAVTVATDAGDSVVLQGFGTFAPRHRAARTGRNPATGEAIEIAASTTLGFKPAKRKAGV